MTNNIVAIFSCSVDSSGAFIVYPVASGSTFTEEYNETLHSASIVLPHVSSEERLDFKPGIRYEFVKLYDASGNTSFSRTYIVDNFVEKEINIKEHIFSYTINLVSQTKMLEKIQCPNMAITHKVNEDGTTTKKTITQYIKQFMELYVPKFKFTSDGTTWDYEPLIKWYTETSGSLASTSNIETPDGFTAGDSGYYCTVSTSTFSDDIDLDSDDVEITGVTFTHLYGSATLSYDSYDVELDTTNRCFNITVYVDSYPSYLSYTSVVVAYKVKQYSYAERFNVPCADMALTAPTLRQLLTTLMQQVGCIPTVEDRTLGYLDFQVDAEQFGSGDYSVDNTVNFIQRSFSGDSAVNSIVKMNSNVLDSENKVVVETLGFRDRSNPFLRQTDNLKLETSFPIYKIEEMRMKALMKASFTLGNPNSGGGNAVGALSIGNDGNGITVTETNVVSPNSFSLFDHTYMSACSIALSGSYYRATITLTFNHSSLSFSDWSAILSFSEVKCYFYNSTNLEANQSFEKAGPVSVSISDLSIPTDSSSTLSFITFSVDAPLEETAFDQVLLVGIITPSFEATSTTGHESDYTNYYFVAANSKTYDETPFLMNLDITPLVKEASVRSLLKTNFVDMANASTIEELGEYIYGTIGYSIGSKEISGFSNTYSIGTATMCGWLVQNYTYIENIFNFFAVKAPLELLSLFYEQYLGNVLNNAMDYASTLADSYSDLDFDSFESSFNSNMISNCSFENLNLFSSQISGVLDTSWAAMIYSFCASIGLIDQTEIDDSNLIPTSEVVEAVSSIFSSNINFAFLFFDIKYQPLNSFNFSYVKNTDLPYSIEQYDGSGDGVSDFDRLSINAQENVERIGNEVLSINQLTTDISDIQDIPSYYQMDFDHDGTVESTKYIIHRKQYSIGNYSISANYTGSKDAILKDYFTSIRTKYRAYQYIDYSSSTLRKRNDTIYVCISENGYFDGDDHVWFGGFDGSFNWQYLAHFINGACPSYTTTGSSRKPLVACCEYSNVEGSTTSYQIVKNDISIVANSNTMALVYECLDNVGSGTYVDVAQMLRGGWFGGVLQAYQIWNEDIYNESHRVFYVNDLGYNEVFDDISESAFSMSSISDITDLEDIFTASGNILITPIVSPDTLDITSDSQVRFALVDDKSSTDYNLTFYKDYAERINHTTEFIYYTDSENVIWTENFIRYNGFMLDKTSTEYDNLIFYWVDISDDDFVLSNSPYDSLDGAATMTFDKTILSTNTAQICSIVFTNSIPYMYLNWDNWTASDSPTALKLVSYNSSTGEYKDIIAFQRSSTDTTTQSFFVSLNDTRSEVVWAEQNGVLYEYGTIKYNTTDREVDDE